MVALMTLPIIFWLIFYAKGFANYELTDFNFVPSLFGNSTKTALRQTVDQFSDDNGFSIMSLLAPYFASLSSAQAEDNQNETPLCDYLVTTENSQFIIEINGFLLSHCVSCSVNDRQPAESFLISLLDIEMTQSSNFPAAALEDEVTFLTNFYYINRSNKTDVLKKAWNHENKFRKDKEMDIWFLLDEKEMTDQNNFEAMKDFVLNVSDSLNNSDKIKLGHSFYPYQDNGPCYFNASTQDFKRNLSLIEKPETPKIYFDESVNQIFDKFVDLPSARRYEMDVRKSLYVITDEQLDIESGDIFGELRSEGIEMYSVGIGDDINFTEVLSFLPWSESQRNESVSSYSDLQYSSDNENIITRQYCRHGFEVQQFVYLCTCCLQCADVDGVSIDIKFDQELGFNCSVCTLPYHMYMSFYLEYSRSGYDFGPAPLEADSKYRISASQSCLENLKADIWYLLHGFRNLSYKDFQTVISYIMDSSLNFKISNSYTQFGLTYFSDYQERTHYNFEHCSSREDFTNVLSTLINPQNFIGNKILDYSMDLIINISFSTAAGARALEANVDRRLVLMCGNGGVPMQASKFRPYLDQWRINITVIVIGPVNVTNLDGLANEENIFLLDSYTELNRDLEYKIFKKPREKDEGLPTDGGEINTNETVLKVNDEIQVNISKNVSDDVLAYVHIDSVDLNSSYIYRVKPEEPETGIMIRSEILALRFPWLEEQDVIVTCTAASTYGVDIVQKSVRIEEVVITEPPSAFSSSSTTVASIIASASPASTLSENDIVTRLDELRELSETCQGEIFCVAVIEEILRELEENGAPLEILEQGYQLVTNLITRAVTRTSTRSSGNLASSTEIEIPENGVAEMQSGNKSWTIMIALMLLLLLCGMMYIAYRKRDKKTLHSSPEKEDELEQLINQAKDLPSKVILQQLQQKLRESTIQISQEKIDEAYQTMDNLKLHIEETSNNLEKMTDAAIHFNGDKDQLDKLEKQIKLAEEINIDPGSLEKSRNMLETLKKQKKMVEELDNFQNNYGQQDDSEDYCKQLQEKIKMSKNMQIPARSIQGPLKHLRQLERKIKVTNELETVALGAKSSSASLGNLNELQQKLAQAELSDVSEIKLQEYRETLENLKIKIKETKSSNEQKAALVQTIKEETEYLKQEKPNLDTLEKFKTAVKMAEELDIPQEQLIESQKTIKAFEESIDDVKNNLRDAKLRCKSSQANLQDLKVLQDAISEAKSFGFSAFDMDIMESYDAGHDVELRINQVKENLKQKTNDCKQSNATIDDLRRLQNDLQLGKNLFIPFEELQGSYDTVNELQNRINFVRSNLQDCTEECKKIGAKADDLRRLQEAIKLGEDMNFSMEDLRNAYDTADELMNRIHTINGWKSGLKNAINKENLEILEDTLRRFNTMNLASNFVASDFELLEIKEQAEILFARLQEAENQKKNHQRQIDDITKELEDALRQENPEKIQSAINHAQQTALIYGSTKSEKNLADLIAKAENEINNPISTLSDTNSVGGLSVEEKKNVEVNGGVVDTGDTLLEACSSVTAISVESKGEKLYSVSDRKTNDVSSSSSVAMESDLEKITNKTAIIGSGSETESKELLQLSEHNQVVLEESSEIHSVISILENDKLENDASSDNILELGKDLNDAPSNREPIVLEKELVSEGVGENKHANDIANEFDNPSIKTDNVMSNRKNSGKVDSSVSTVDESPQNAKTDVDSEKEATDEEKQNGNKTQDEPEQKPGEDCTINLLKSPEMDDSSRENLQDDIYGSEEDIEDDPVTMNNIMTALRDIVSKGDLDKIKVGGLIAELERKYGKLSKKGTTRVLIDIERYIVLLGLQRSVGRRNGKMIKKALARKDYALENKLKDYNLSADKEMTHYIDRANDLLILFEMVERMKSVVMSLKQPTISEVRSYSHPPPAIKNVMQATYILLGEEKAKIKLWPSLKNLIGKTGKLALKRRIWERDLENVSSESALEAERLISGFSKEDVEVISKAAGVFYSWSTCVIHEAKDREKFKAIGKLHA